MIIGLTVSLPFMYILLGEKTYIPDWESQIREKDRGFASIDQARVAGAEYVNSLDVAESVLYMSER